MKTPDTTLSVRARAIQTLVAVQNGKSLASLLSNELSTIADKDRGLFHELVNGTLRHWFAFIRVSDNLAHHPITDTTVLAALHTGMYQLFYLRTPDHAAIGETVTAVKQVGKPELAGLVNAILRKCQKDATKLEKKIKKNHSLPNWLAKQLKTDWKPYYTALSTSLRSTAPIFLRVNKKQVPTSEYLTLLNNDDIAHYCEADVIRLDTKMPIEALPGFEEGYISVQDTNAQKAVSLFSDLTDKTVLDACAAPGGKTAQLLEQFNVAQLTAVDIEAHRTMRIADNLSRLGLLADNVQLITADMTKDNALDDKLYDAILLDAPCTATGVIRRHPDISLLRQESDVLQTVTLQQNILVNAWKMLKVGGELVYVTCSLLKQENTEQIAGFLATHDNAKEEKLKVEWGIAQPHGVQCLPIALSTNEDEETTESNALDNSTFIGDGFYFAKLIKTA